MGVNVHCKLPGDVRVDDAADVIGILAGLPIVDHHTIRDQLGFAIHVPEATEETETYSTVAGVKINGCSQGFPMVDITLDGNMVDDTQAHHWYWHFEGDNGTRFFNPPTTGFWIAVCRGLVDFFGGEMIYADCGDSLCDYRQQAIHSNETDNDMVYEQMQYRKRHLTPLTKSDLEHAEQFLATKQGRR